MEKLKYRNIMVAVIFFWSQRTFSAAPPLAAPKPQPNKWKVLFLSTGLAAVNYYALNRALVPLTVRVSKGSISPSLAFASWALVERFASPLLMKYVPTGFFTKKEWKDSQRNAMLVATAIFLTPDTLKDRLKSIIPALRRSFFKKTHNGITVKSFEQFQEITPKITELNNEIKNSFQKIITLEDTIKSLKARLNTSDLTPKVKSGIEQDISKNTESCKNAIIEFSNFLIQKESQREALYENYKVPELENLKMSAATLLNQSKSKDFLQDFNSLKELYTKIQGGILGFVGEGLKYFEGE